MRSEKKILVAFLLNLSFSLFEFVGGIYTGSMAVISDAVHDLGDAVGIGASCFFEKKSKGGPDGSDTYGCGRYSVLGGAVTTLMLLAGSGAVIFHALGRLWRPAQVDSGGMILFAVVGICVNLAAAISTRGGTSLNQKAVNLHMLEDVFGWAAVLAGGIVIAVTGWMWVDAVICLCAAGYILQSAVKNLLEILRILLEKTPRGLSAEELAGELAKIPEVAGVHHIHLWSLDGQIHCATMHVVAAAAPYEVKEKVRAALRRYGISHAVLELEEEGEVCPDFCCRVETIPQASGRCHHRHHEKTVKSS